MCVVIGELQKNRQEIYRITKQVYKNVELIDVRVFRYNLEKDEYCRTRKGLAVPLSQFNDVLHLLNKAKPVVQESESAKLDNAPFDDDEI